jgi:hypothetical protein
MFFLLKWIIKGVLFILGGVLGLLLFVLAGLYLYANIGIPQGVEVDYVKGIWEPMAPFVFLIDMDRLKADGINTISFGPPAFHWSLNIAYKPIAAAIVKRAHKKGLAVHLAPNSWGPGFSVHDPHPEMEPWLTEVAIEWAKFAEKYNVDFYSPQNEPDIVLGVEGIEAWAEKILPEIKKHYSGTTVLKLGTMMINPDEGGSYSYRVDLPYWSGDDAECQGYIYYPRTFGWDYLMVDIFPDDDLTHTGTFPENLGRLIDTAVDWAEKQENKGVMMGEFAYPRNKPGLVASIMPGPEVSPEDQALRTGEYLDAAMPKVDGVIYCGWILSGYGIKGYPVEAAIKEKFVNFEPSPQGAE